LNYCFIGDQKGRVSEVIAAIEASEKPRTATMIAADNNRVAAMDRKWIEYRGLSAHAAQPRAH
jgi:metal-dependent amidase/aminoacylase/carboxypeptidase family protein